MTLSGVFSRKEHCAQNVWAVCRDPKHLPRPKPSTGQVPKDGKDRPACVNPEDRISVLEEVRDVFDAGLDGG